MPRNPKPFPPVQESPALHPLMTNPRAVAESSSVFVLLSDDFCVLYPQRKRAISTGPGGERTKPKMEQLSDEELDHAAEEDSDKEDQDLDQMFGAWLGELDKLTQSLDDGKPEKVQKAPLRQETNLANFSYRFSMYNINEALNQGDAVDLDALMADLCSIEQELSSIGKPNSGTSRLGVPAESKLRQKPPVGRSGSAKHGGGGGGAAAAAAAAAPPGPRPPPPLDDITAQLEQASLSMDEAARQSSSPSAAPASSSSSSSSSSAAAPPRRPSSTSSHHRRTGSAGTVSDHEVRSIGHSSRSSVNSASASSMDSLDIDKVLRPPELDGLPTPPAQQQQPPPQGQPSTELKVQSLITAAAPHAPLRRHSGKQARRHLDFASQEVEVDLSTHSYLDRETSLILKNIAGKPSHLLTKEEQAAKLKAEKIRVALEKIKEAQVKKLVIRVHMSDESSKTMMVDERQTVRQVLDSLLDKSHCGYSPDWSLVETISELQMERIFEDHENLVENLLNWTRDSQNKLMFIERIEKYALFKNPQNYLLGRKETSEMADRNKEALLEECFCGSSVSVPEIEGVLWLKEDGKKSWKKRYFLLRASGIYFVPKGKAKASRDLVCFLQLDHVNVYYGQDYRSKYKAPTDYCLALKHPQIQKKSQYIKYLCCEDVRTLHQWVNGIRIAKYGKQLYVNYQEAMKRTEAAYDWSSLSSSSIKSGSSSSSLPESHSNHSTQSDSGVSDTTSSGHARSQSVVSSIFSEAWKRGTQMEENTKVRVEPSRAAHPSQTRGSFTHASPQPSPPPPPPPPPRRPRSPTRRPTTTSPPCSPMKKQQSFSSGSSSSNQPPPTLPKQHSFSSKALPLSTPISPTPSLVKQMANQFPGSSPTAPKVPLVLVRRKRPPPTPQRNSSIKSGSPGEYQESKKVESLVSKFAQPPPAPSSPSSPSSSSGSPSKEPVGPPAPPKPGKLNLAGLPLALQAKASQHRQHSSDFPSPPSECDYFPPPPPDSELLPPPPLPPDPSHSGAPKVAVQPPPTPTSPKGTLAVQPNFLADLNRTLKRKSITRHGSLTSSRISARLEPVATMDDMALPPPAPELLLDSPKQGGYMSGNISGYATLRRGPPPAPPKRDQSTKLTGEW
ncbi:hypothetical protein AAFF_G00213240 [Aldrovandia affinis]|uniref:Ras association (RalGDS/AF-6) and pleckstrin homology domains 1 n=1 Tax=Aldrovandia affinis TaxID=143900 RepID=A0AAD7W5B8_9TELE|nr:hypothetical protein AAFF_G00213240 [Aldrovandia affinis]